MIDYYHYRPQDTETQQPEDNQQPELTTRKKHRIRKWLLLFILVAAVIVGFLLVAGYWYVQNTSLNATDQRTNILILGVDEVASLSDTIMLMSIDQTNPDNPDVALLSIPRDLYIEVPGFWPSKINAAYAIGENNDYSGGGPALSADTIEEHFDIDIHYYMSVDFDGLKTLIDAIGGVEIDVLTTIDDPLYPDERGGYDPLYISAGLTRMDGDLALKYTRSRQSTNDFDRAFRQQQVVLAASDKILEDSQLWRPRTIRGLLTLLADNVQTDLSTLELAQLGNTMRTTDIADVPQYVLDTTNLLSGVSNETGSALIPRTGNFGEIQLFVETIFSQSDIDQFSQQQF